MDWTVVAWHVVSEEGNKGRRRADAYVDNAAKSPDGIGSENNICTATSVLHDCTCDHNDVLGRAGQLLDDKVYHLSQGGIFVLE